MAINIQISDEAWKQLNERKAPGESFDSVINKMLLKTPPLKTTKQKEVKK